MRQSSALIVTYTVNDEECLTFFELLTLGDPNNVVCCYGQQPDALSTQRGAKAKLQHRYGNSDIIAAVNVQKAHHWPQVKAHNWIALDKHAVFLEDYLHALHGIWVISEFSKS